MTTQLFFILKTCLILFLILAYFHMFKKDMIVLKGYAFPGIIVLLSTAVIKQPILHYLIPLAFIALYLFVDKRKVSSKITAFTFLSILPCILAVICGSIQVGLLYGMSAVNYYFNVIQIFIVMSIFCLLVEIVVYFVYKVSKKLPSNGELKESVRILIWLPLSIVMIFIL